jgi:hypothetical protein
MEYDGPRGNREEQEKKQNKTDHGPRVEDHLDYITTSRNGHGSYLFKQYGFVHNPGVIDVVEAMGST